MRKTYKDCRKVYIGSSDIASLLMLGISGESGIEDLRPMIMSFGTDGEYYAYIVPEDVEIGGHYKKVAEYRCWFKIFDDSKLTLNISAERINVYRAGELGCIIQVVNPESDLENL